MSKMQIYFSKQGLRLRYANANRMAVGLNCKFAKVR